MTMNTIAKLAVTGVLLFCLFYFLVDVNAVITQLKGISIGYYAIAFLLNTLGIIVNTKRWQMVLKARNVAYPYINLFKLHYIGSFFSSFLPGTVGGDAVKIYKMQKASEEDTIELAGSVIADRFVGVLIIYLAAIVGLAINYGHLNSEIDQILFFVLLIMTTIFIIIAKRKWAIGCLNLALKILPFLRKFEEKFVQMYDVVSVVWASGKSVFGILGCASLYFFVCYVGSTYFLLVALGTPCSYLFLLSFLPIINLVVMLPISFSGIGIRESLLWYFLAFESVPKESAISVGFLLLSFKLINSLIGAVLNVTSK